MIPRTNAIDYRGRRIRVEQVAERLPRIGLLSLAVPRTFGGMCTGMGRWLLIRRDGDDPSDDAY